MLMLERHDQIIKILSERQTVRVAELSALLKVSAVTIRNDLRHLSEQGQVVRTHGGAALADDTQRQELSFATRRQIRAEQKRQIGELAATLIKPVESILIDSSTTAVAVGQAIKYRTDLPDLTVIVTGLWSALEMMGSSYNVILAGGNLRHTTGSTTGPIANDMLSKINIHKAFLGAWGITLNEGLTDTNLREAELKQAVVARCREVIAVVDGSKFGQVSLATFAPTEKITRIVTDMTAPMDLVEAFRAKGIEVLIAGEV